MDGMEVKAGAVEGARPYNEEQRRVAIERYRKKRINRNFNKRIMYPCRKRHADSQHRVGGRFARSEKIETVETNYHVLVQNNSYSDQYQASDSGSGEWMRQMHEWVRHMREEACFYLDLDVFPDEVLQR